MSVFFFAQRMKYVVCGGDTAGACGGVAVSREMQHSVFSVPGLRVYGLCPGSSPFRFDCTTRKCLSLFGWVVHVVPLPSACSPAPSNADFCFPPIPSPLLPLDPCAVEFTLCVGKLLGSAFLVILNTEQWTLHMVAEDTRPAISHMSACLSGPQRCLVSGLHMCICAITSFPGV